MTLRVVRYPVVAVVAALAGMLGAVPVAPVGLVVPMYIVWPLALGVAALLAAVAASWTGNLLMTGRSCLLAVVGVTEGAALVLSALMAVPYFVPALEMVVLGGSLIHTIGACAAVIGLVAGVASLHLRGTRGRLGWDGAAALLSSVVSLVLLLLIEGAGLVPGLPEMRPVSAGYGEMVMVSLIFLALGVLLAAWRSPRSSPGHELGRDAALTLALVAAVMPVVAGTFALLCSTLVTCMA